MIETWDRLFEVNDVPLDPTGTPLDQYARFKVGVTSAVDHYARDLKAALPPALELSPPQDGRWLIASPPVSAAPAAANLLAKALRDTSRWAPVDTDLSLVELRKAPLAELFFEEHYGARGLHGRREHVQRSAPGWTAAATLSGASVLFINDIHVTGTQQGALGAFLKRRGVQRVHWQYLFSVSTQEVEAAAGIESRLNVVGLEDDEKFVEFLVREDLVITSKCLWRLFATDLPLYDRAINFMPMSRRTELIGILAAEQVPATPNIAPRLELLHRHTQHQPLGGQNE